MTEQSVHYHGPGCDPPHRGEQFLGDHGDELADLRAKVLGLPRVTDDYYREAVLLADVLALLGRCPND